MVAIQSIQFPEVFLIQGAVYSDERGIFTELFRNVSYAEAGINCEFVQDNLSVSKAGVIRGMHFQSEPGQAKLVACLSGEIFDVFVDIRIDSKTFGKWGSFHLKANTGAQLFIPAGFAHGFASLCDSSIVMYKVSSLYDPKTEKGFCYNDPSVGIEWPISNPTLSERDRNAPTFNQVLERESLDSRC